MEQLAPLGAPPDGQNTDTSVSLASQLTVLSACTERMACAESPLGPGTPCGPCGPCAPCAPCAPGCPCGPGTPWTPCAPCGPAGPCAPGSPFGPGSRLHAASSSATPPTATRMDRLICCSPSPRPRLYYTGAPTRKQGESSHSFVGWQITRARRS